MPANVTRALLALTLVASTSGCSFLVVEKAPSTAAQARMPYFDCTSSRLAPGTDTVLTGIFALAFLGSLAPESGTTSAEKVSYAGIGGALLASAYYGFREVSRCHDAKSALWYRANRGPAGPGQPGTPPAGTPYPAYGLPPPPPAPPPAPSPPQPTGPFQVWDSPAPAPSPAPPGPTSARPPAPSPAPGTPPPPPAPSPAPPPPPPEPYEGPAQP